MRSVEGVCSKSAREENCAGVVGEALSHTLRQRACQFSLSRASWLPNVVFWRFPIRTGGCLRNVDSTLSASKSSFLADPLSPRQSITYRISSYPHKSSIQQWSKSTSGEVFG